MTTVDLLYKRDLLSCKLHNSLLIKLKLIHHARTIQISRNRANQSRECSTPEAQNISYRNAQALSRTFFCGIFNRNRRQFTLLIIPTSRGAIAYSETKVRMQRPLAGLNAVRSQPLRCVVSDPRRGFCGPSERVQSYESITDCASCLNIGWGSAG